MKLDRNENPKGKGKYALLNLRKDKVEWGEPETEDEFFVIKLKDRHAQAALNAYVESLENENGVSDYSRDVRELADRSGEDSQWCKDPD